MLERRASTPAASRSRRCWYKSKAAKAVQMCPTPGETELPLELLKEISSRQRQQGKESSGWNKKNNQGVCLRAGREEGGGV